MLQLQLHLFVLRVCNMDRLLWFKRDNAQCREDWIAGNKFIHIISILHNINYAKLWCSKLLILRRKIMFRRRRRFVRGRIRRGRVRRRVRRLVIGNRW